MTVVQPTVPAYDQPTYGPGYHMDAERANRFKDPNELFINTPDGAYGPSGYTEMNMMRWINDKIAALFRGIRRRRRG